ncbi:MAG TPA: NAD(+) diphosphatase [Arenimonas sp.]|nr:NAD(+) diphosphatase [Arenimonas sp.]
MERDDFAFQHIGLERAEPLRSQPQRLDELWSAALVLVLNEHGEACSFGTHQYYYPANKISMQRPVDATFLGIHQDQGYFAIPLELIQKNVVELINIRSAASVWSNLHSSIFAQAKALLHWQSQSKFCGRCGGLLIIKTAGYSAACPSCDLIVYPQTHPAVIMSVSDGQRILLGRQKSWPEKRWSVLAGFMEPGESPEQTVVREVWEEAGVKVEKVAYLKSQPWPMPMALMIGFKAYAPYQEINISDELQAAQWFSASELLELVAQGDLELPSPMSISRYLIQDWLQHSAESTEFWHTKGPREDAA